MPNKSCHLQRVLTGAYNLRNVNRMALDNSGPHIGVDDCGRPTVDGYRISQGGGLVTAITLTPLTDAEKAAGILPCLTTNDLIDLLLLVHTQNIRRQRIRAENGE